MLADYAVADAANKLTIVGGGVSIVTHLPNTGQTAPFAVLAVVTFDPAFIGESPAVELLLEDQTGQPVALPGAVGQLGQPQYIRVGLSHQLEAKLPQNQRIPRTAMRPRVQILLNFQGGLPLPAGQRYTWRVRIDGDSSDEWTEWLYVPESAPGVAVG
ncbi:hypothetical protein [Mycobacterium nebraskense]|uniref:hypothetical protein n=1 Tax=Mycobacterium nebraskense TaxID=244292 RepID=UPI0012E0E816|nr:hypothetical protein [Mycobacterium nebraskense]